MSTFVPKKFKYKKIHKNVTVKNTKDFKINVLNSSVCGLKILKSGTISSIVFEAVRRIIRRKTKKEGSLYINGFPSIPVTKKAIGLRMGKGVGSVDSWVYSVKKGRILFELKNISLELGKIALKAAANKLNLPSKIIYNYSK